MMGRVKKLAKWGALVSVGLLLTSLIVLFTTGYSLTLFTGTLSAPASGTSPAYRLEGLLIKGNFKGELGVFIDGIAVGDAADSGALAVEHAEVRWKLSSMLRLNAAPAAVEAGDVVVRLRRDESGALGFMQLPAGEPKPEAPATAPSLPPSWLLPREGRPLAILVDSIRVLVPQADGSTREVAAKIDGDITRAGTLLNVVQHLTLGETGGGAPIVGNLQAGLSLDNGDLAASGDLALPGIELARVFVPDLPAELRGGATGSLTAHANLLKPGAAQVRATFTMADLRANLPDMPVALDRFAVTLDATTEGDMTPERAIVALETDLGTAPAVRTRVMIALADAFQTIDLHVDNHLAQSGWFCTLLPGAGIPVNSVPVQTTIDARFHVDTLTLEKLAVRAVGEPGFVDLQGEHVALPPWIVELTGDAVLDGAPGGRLDLEASVAPDEGLPVHARLGVQLDPATGNASVQTGADLHLGPLAALMKGLPVELLEGDLCFEAEATANIEAARLDGATARVRSGGIEVFSSAFLAKPLVVKSFEIVASVGEQAAAGHVEPFAFALGPLQVKCPGLQWKTDAGAISGGGGVEVEPLELADLLALLPPALTKDLPFPQAQMAELGVRRARVDVNITGSDPAKPAIDVDASSVFRLNEGELAVQATARADMATQSWSTTVTVPDFVQAQWRLGLFDTLQLPALDAPVRARFAAEGSMDGQLDRATWDVSAGPGHVVPVGLLAPWLAKPLPVDVFAMGGRIEAGGRRLALDRFEVASGRGSVKFSRVDVQSPEPLPALGPGETVAALSFTMEDWYLGDFLPLLTPEAAAMLPLPRADLDTLGLESFTVEAEVALAAGEGGAPVLRRASAANQAVFRAGGARIPMDVQLGAEPDGSAVFATATLHQFRPDTVQLSLLGGLPVQPSVLQFPVEVEIKAGAGLAGTQLTPGRLSVGVRAGPGRVAPNAFLAQAVPLKSFDLQLGARLDTLSLESLTMALDLDGPRVCIDDVRVQPVVSGQPIRGEMHLRAEAFDFAWMKSLVVGELVPEAQRALFAQAQVGGRLDHFDLRAGFAVNPEAPGPDALQSLGVDMLVEGITLALPDMPPAHVARVALGADLDLLWVTVDDAGLIGAGAEQLRVEVTQPLGAAPVASLNLRTRADLAALQGLVEQWTTRPEALDPALLEGLAGDARFMLQAAVPVSDPRPETVTAKAQTRLTGLQVPTAYKEMVPGGIGFEFDVAVDNVVARFDGRADLSQVRQAELFAGPVAITFNGEGGMETARGTVSIDLSGAGIHLPSNLWNKEPGRRAGIGLDLKAGGYGQPDGPIDAHLNWALDGLFYAKQEGGLDIVAQPTEGAEFGGLRNVALRHRFGRSDFGLAADMAPGRVSVTARSDVIDVPELVQLLEPFLHQLSVALAEAAAAGETPAEPPAAPIAGPVPAAPAAPLPDIDLALDIGRIQMGFVEQFENLSLRARVIKGVPHSADFSVGMEGPAIRASLLPGAFGVSGWSLEVEDTSALVARTLAPLSVIPETDRPPGSIFATALSMYDLPKGGHIQAAGTIDLPKARNLSADLRITNLAIRKEIPFLNRIAALVDRRMLVELPFDRFELSGIQLMTGDSLERATIAGGYLDGPINLEITTLDANLLDNTLLFQGKVWGICFEVAGPLDGPSFYLCDKMPGVDMITEEDEFEW